MIGDRLIQAGGAKLAAALGVAVIVLTVLLAASVWVNVLQFRGKARAVGEVIAQLASTKATYDAEIASCAATNANVNATVSTLEAELLQCREEQQDRASALELALRQRDRARRAVEGEIANRRTLIEALSNEDCNRSLCRSLSERLLQSSAGDPAR